jgi:hypothetical protein
MRILIAETTKTLRQVASKKSSNQKTLNKELMRIRTDLENYSFFSWDIKDKKEVTRQRGILRVNCLDCLEDLRYLSLS